MAVTGTLFIGGREEEGKGAAFRATAASHGHLLEPTFRAATSDQLEQACARADEAFAAFALSSPQERAAFLEAIGENIFSIGDELIDRAMAETGLPKPRLEGERARTVNQLRSFAAILRNGTFARNRIDPANPERQPTPKPDLRMTYVALGPVAVFAASNFPLAFSVAGGDTASAFAAGCPVIVKAHSAHPGTSELVGRAVCEALQASGLPSGVFSLLFDDGFTVGQGLVADQRIAAVGFTGSRRGGLALADIAAKRSVPIPVYAEMSAVNPVILMPHRLQEDAEAIASGFATALTMGAGQFCTNPGLVLAVDSPGLDNFIITSSMLIMSAAAAPMLTPGILGAYEARTEQLAEHAGVAHAATGLAGPTCAASALFVTNAKTFLSDRTLHDEVFGASSLVVRCASLDELRAVVEEMEGQLTVSIHMNSADYDAVGDMLPALERKAGRIIANGFGTGVEVSPAMVHGGPFPATSDGRSTSVGTLAIERFQRPVSFQDFPEALLPAALKDANPWKVRRETF